MTPDLYWIPLESPGRLAIAARPRGGDWLADEIDGWERAGIGMVVSLLTPDEESELGLAGEAVECDVRGVRFVSLPVPDRSIPADRPAFDNAVKDVVSALDAGLRVATHCRQGIGRSALFSAAVLKAMGFTTEDAVRRLSVARGRSIPETPEQADWLARYVSPQRGDRDSPPGAQAPEPIEPLETPL